MEEKLESIRCKLVDAVYEELEHNMEGVKTCELGEVVDMIKDISETIYYHTVVEAMDKKEYTIDNNMVTRNMTEHTVMPSAPVVPK